MGYNGDGPSCGQSLVDPGWNPATAFTGTQTLSITDIEAALGVRNPSYANSPKNFTAIIFIVVPYGMAVDNNWISTHVNGYFTYFPAFWHSLTKNRSTVTFPDLIPGALPSPSPTPTPTPTPTPSPLPIPSLSVISSKNPSTYGTSITFTATLGGGNSPTGTISFKDGSTVICSSMAISGGKATCTTNSLSVTNHSISATYNGDTQNQTSNSPTMTQTVTQGTGPTPTPTPTTAIPALDKSGTLLFLLCNGIVIVYYFGRRTITKKNRS
ncbi:MAG: Ig-like domain repeat protein [Nitrospirae bacterium]|nr:Ig-like domain repeat protein [Nitrospirota bacterium]